MLTRVHKTLRILVLGGTKFLGRATVEAALDRGHDVTLFNRGETNPELFPDVEKIRGDRTADLSPLEGGRWDTVVDPSGYFPDAVRRSAGALRDSVGRYLFVSSVSVYADLSEGPSEESPRAELGDHPIDEMLPEYENYGALKALCEDAVWEVYGDRATIVRPGLIVGPHDPTGRFTYWPHRAARGGEMVVPAPPERTVQFVDVRDLGRWLVELLERDEGGAFNATRSAVSWRELIDSARSVAGSDATPVWIPDEFLSEHDVGEWMELPLWLADPEWVGMNQADVSRAEAAGLSHRPLEDTIRGTLDEAETTDGAGMKPDRELELLEAWRAA
jgi:2'-hydroxyisoflavone reductase